MSDSFEINVLVRKMRVFRQLTQRQLADLLHVNVKTVSNWERKKTYIDGEMASKIFRVLDIKKDSFLTPINPRAAMKDIFFFVCPVCKSVIWSFTSKNPVCCGIPLSPLTPQPFDEHHNMDMELSDSGLCYDVTLRHDITQDHYISFVAFVSGSSVLITKLEPGKNPAAMKPIMHKGKLYLYCTKHGLFENIE